MSQALPDSVRALIENAAQEAGVRVYEVEFHGRTLRVLIENDTGITVGICAQVSELISAKLDQSDMIQGRYYLEVSSPGLERKLRGISDFEREVGKQAHVVTARGAFDGRILRVEGETVVLAIVRNEREEELTFPASEIKRAHLRVSDKELFAGQPST